MKQWACDNCHDTEPDSRDLPDGWFGIEINNLRGEACSLTCAERQLAWLAAKDAQLALEALDEMAGK